MAPALTLLTVRAKSNSYCMARCCGMWDQHNQVLCCHIAQVYIPSRNVTAWLGAKRCDPPVPADSTHLPALRVCLGQPRHPCRGQPKLGSLAQDQRLQLRVQHAHDRGACQLVQPALQVPGGLVGACSDKSAPC